MKNEKELKAPYLGKDGQVHDAIQELPEFGCDEWSKDFENYEKEVIERYKNIGEAFYIFFGISLGENGNKYIPFKSSVYIKMNKPRDILDDDFFTKPTFTIDKLPQEVILQTIELVDDLDSPFEINAVEVDVSKSPLTGETNVYASGPLFSFNQCVPPGEIHYWNKIYGDYLDKVKN